MQGEWYFTNGGDAVGPIPEDLMAMRIASGEVNARSLVWRQGMDGWKPLNQSDLNHLLEATRDPFSEEPQTYVHEDLRGDPNRWRLKAETTSQDALNQDSEDDGPIDVRALQTETSRAFGEPSPAPKHKDTDIFDAEDARTAFRAANWFFGITAFTVINMLLILVGTDFGFWVGLASADVLAGLGYLLFEEYGSMVVYLGAGAGIAISLPFLLFGFFGSKGHSWAFLVGALLYAVDGLLRVLFLQVIGAIIHYLVAFLLIRGYIATLRVKGIAKAQAASASA